MESSAGLESAQLDPTAILGSDPLFRSPLTLCRKAARGQRGLFYRQREAIVSVNRSIPSFVNVAETGAVAPNG